MQTGPVTNTPIDSRTIIIIVIVVWA